MYLYQRFFMFSAIFNHWGVMHSKNFGTQRDIFPSMYELKQQVIDAHEGADQIVILSICELSEDDYKTFWGDIINNK